MNDELTEAQNSAKKAGKIRFAGVSFHGGHAEMVPAMIKLNHFDVFLMSYNFTMDPSTDALIAQAKKAKIGVVAMKGLAGGVKPTVRSYTVPADMLNRLNRPGAAVSEIKWVLKNPNIDTIIPSITDNDQLDENLRAMSSPFSAADGKLLWKTPNGEAWHRPSGGSRTTPTYSQGAVYQMSPHARIAAFEARSGKEIWGVDLKERFEAYRRVFPKAHRVILINHEDCRYYEALKSKVLALLDSPPKANKALKDAAKAFKGSVRA